LGACRLSAARQKSRLFDRLTGCCLSRGIRLNPGEIQRIGREISTTGQQVSTPFPDIDLHQQAGKAYK
jgi:hypothetical protein